MSSHDVNNHVQITRDDSVLCLAMNRPEKKNAITFAMYEAMSEGLRRADCDDTVHVVLIHGQGGNFTAGNDLQDFLHNPPKDESAPVFQFMLALSQLKKPVIAAVDGVAVGIGTTMLLHCDLVYASADAKFMMPFVSLGLTPEAGSSYLLPLLSGYQRAAELLLLAESFTAEKAAEIGLVNTIVPVPNHLEFARQQARNLAAKPLASVLLTKKLLKAAHAEIIRRTISNEASVLIERLVSPEAKTAFETILRRK